MAIRATPAGKTSLCSRTLGLNIFGEGLIWGFSPVSKAVVPQAVPGLSGDVGRCWPVRVANAALGGPWPRPGVVLGEGILK